jgi:plasmid stabilization system protein ParE
MSVRLRTTVTADEQARNADTWWRDNRREAPNLFREELEKARELLAVSPRLGVPYAHRTMVGVRRLVLPRTRYHLYYTFDPVENEILVLAVWSTLRGAPPLLRNT